MAIKVLSIAGVTLPVPTMQRQMSAVDDMSETDLDDEGSEAGLLNEEMAATVKTLEREVSQCYRVMMCTPSV